MFGKNSALFSLTLLFSGCVDWNYVDDWGDSETAGSDTDGAHDWFECLPPDSQADANFFFDLSSWDPVFSAGGEWGDPVYTDFEAECLVDFLESGQYLFMVWMTCMNSDQPEQMLPAAFNLPDDVELPFNEGDGIRLRFSGKSWGHHDGPQSQFAIYDMFGQLLMTGFDKESGILNLVDIDLGLDFIPTFGDCPNPCYPNYEDCEDPVRMSIKVQGGQSEPVQVLDQRRGLFILDDSVYDYLVPKAEEWYCLNCFSDYRALLVIQ